LWGEGEYRGKRKRDLNSSFFIALPLKQEINQGRRRKKKKKEG